MTDLPLAEIDAEPSSKPRIVTKPVLSADTIVKTRVSIMILVLVLGVLLLVVTVSLFPDGIDSSASRSPSIRIEKSSPSRISTSKSPSKIKFS